MVEGGATTAKNGRAGARRALYAAAASRWVIDPAHGRNGVAAERNVGFERISAQNWGVSRCDSEWM